MSNTTSILYNLISTNRISSHIDCIRTETYLAFQIQTSELRYKFSIAFQQNEPMKKANKVSAEAIHTKQFPPVEMQKKKKKDSYRIFSQFFRLFNPPKNKNIKKQNEYPSPAPHSVNSHRPFSSTNQCSRFCPQKNIACLEKQISELINRLLSFVVEISSHGVVADNSFLA